MGYSSFIRLVELRLIFLSLKKKMFLLSLLKVEHTRQRIKKFRWLTCCSFRRNISISMWIWFSSSVFNLSFCENNKPTSGILPSRVGNEHFSRSEVQLWQPHRFPFPAGIPRALHIAPELQFCSHLLSVHKQCWAVCRAVC